MLCIPSSIFFSYIDIYIVCRSLQICGLCSTPKAFIRERSLSCHVWTLFFEVSFTFSRFLWQAGVAGGSRGYIFQWNCENNPCIIRKLMIGSLIECRYDFSDLKLTSVLHLFLFFSFCSPSFCGPQFAAVYADAATDGGWIHDHQGQNEITDHHHLLRLLHPLRHFLRNAVHRGGQRKTLMT